jgi:hypothetical protein
MVVWTVCTWVEPHVSRAVHLITKRKGERQRERSLRRGSETKYLQLGPSLKVFRTSQNSATGWEPSVQEFKTVGTFHIQIRTLEFSHFIF